MKDITTLIISKLAAIFGEDVTVYRENVKDGFKENSFFIPAFDIKSKSKVNFTDDITFNCQLIYFPRLNKINDDISDVQTKLVINFSKLEDMDIFNQNYTVSDDSLVVTFDVKGYVVPEDVGSKLGILKMKGSE